MLESNLELKVVKLCKRWGMITYKFVSPSNRGVPDRIIICNGSVLFLELKQAGKKPTSLQMHEINRLRKSGCNAEWADNYDTAKSILLDHIIPK
tara:strand:+ start:4727 stop:5008 length:282 start_codon:yes stop_codon:yes gene_type:complete